MQTGVVGRFKAPIRLRFKETALYFFIKFVSKENTMSVEGETAAVTKVINATPAPERPDLDRLIKEARVMVAEMSPEEREAMFAVQGQNWADSEMKLDRKTGSAVETRIMQHVDEAHKATVPVTPVDDASLIAILVAGLKAAQQEFNVIACEGVTETRSLSDAFERAQAFANRGAVSVGKVLATLSVEAWSREVDAADIGRALKVLVNENPEKHQAALQKPSLRGWFTGQIMKKFEGKVEQSFVSHLVETVFEFTAPSGNPQGT